MSNDVIRDFSHRRKESLIADMLRLYQEGKLTSEKACGIAAAIMELRLLERDISHRIFDAAAKIRDDKEMIADE